MTFPLYDILLKDLVDEDLSLDNKKELIELIHTLDDKCHQNIFSLIRMYGIRANSGNIENLGNIPFDGQTDNKNVKFNLDKLPNIIKQMIYKFIFIHRDKMKEEKEERKN